ncbi:MAG: hypothetical protein WCA17_03865, partial [Burkholderiales bacterium]
MNFPSSFVPGKCTISPPVPDYTAFGEATSAPTLIQIKSRATAQSVNPAFERIEQCIELRGLQMVDAARLAASTAA